MVRQETAAPRTLPKSGTATTSLSEARTGDVDLSSSAVVKVAATVANASPPCCVPLARSNGPFANNLHPRIMFAGIMTANCSDWGRRFRCAEKPGSATGPSAESVRHDPAFVKHGSLSRHLLMRSLLMFRSGKHC